MNMLKTAVLLALLTGLLITAGSFFGGARGMVLMFIVSMAINFFSYWFSDKIVLRMYGATEVDMNSAPQLVGMVANLARRAELPMPRVYIIETDAPNAFATGRDPDHSAVAVTSSLMRSLSPEELIGTKLAPVYTPPKPISTPTFGITNTARASINLPLM